MNASRSAVREPRTIWCAVAWLGLVVLWNAAFVAPMFGPLIHESDQASLLEGAVSIAQTGRLNSNTFYNYDKQFGSYWIVATALRFLGAAPDPNAIVAMGNAVSVAFFNAGLILLSLSITSPSTLLLLGCLLFAPSFLIHAPFLAGNYLSAFFLIAQFIALRKHGSIVAPMLLAFCATACRADAALAQPILLWSTTRAETLRSWLQEKRLWGCVVAAGGAVLVGNTIAASGAESSSPFAIFVHWKILAAYSVFGLGAGIGILLLGIAGLARAGGDKAPSGFEVAGLLSLLLSFGYYLVNLYSTRHWTVALVALMCFVASLRGQRLVSRLFSTNRVKSAVYALLVFTAFLPLLIGFGLSSRGVPRLTVTRPALVPSADGLIPLGGYLAYAWGWDRDQRQIPDHNQATWLATLAADFGTSKQSPIRLLVTPLASIVRLGVHLRGFEYELTESPQATPVYAEFRALRKTPIGHRGLLHNRLAEARSYGVELASPIVAGEAIVRLTQRRNSFAEELQTLREAFGGNDYHVSKTDPETALAEANPGQIVVLVSPTPFRLNLGSRVLFPRKNRMTERDDCYLLSFVVEDTRTFTIEGAVALTALSVLPQFMTVENY